QHLAILNDVPDKYEMGADEITIDCEARLPLCQARCCTFAFALSEQDLDERVVRWEYGSPYVIARLSDGYCAHQVRDEENEGVRKFMGQVPSSCSFWRVAQSAAPGKSAFFTVPSDHYNCPIGSYTHNVALPKDREHELTDVLGLMAQIGYVRMEEIPQIPRW